MKTNIKIIISKFQLITELFVIETLTCLLIQCIYLGDNSGLAKVNYTYHIGHNWLGWRRLNESN